jgi:hypothetical protein
MYAEVTVLVDGAVDEEATFSDEAMLNDFLASVERGAQADGIRAEVFVLFHDHSPGDCECAQYVTDHKPYAVYDHTPEYAPEEYDMSDPYDIEYDVP